VLQKKIHSQIEQMLMNVRDCPELQNEVLSNYKKILEINCIDSKRTFRFSEPMKKKMKTQKHMIKSGRDRDRQRDYGIDSNSQANQNQMKTKQVVNDDECASESDDLPYTASCPDIVTWILVHQKQYFKPFTILQLLEQMIKDYPEHYQHRANLPNIQTDFDNLEHWIDCGYRKNIKKIFGPDKITMLNQKLSPYNLKCKQIKKVQADPTYQLQRIHDHQTNEHQYSTTNKIETRSSKEKTKKTNDDDEQQSQQSSEDDEQEHNSINVDESDDDDDEMNGDEPDISIQQILSQTLKLANSNNDLPMNFQDIEQYIEKHSSLRSLKQQFIKQKHISSRKFESKLRHSLKPSEREALHTTLYDMKLNVQKTGITNQYTIEVSANNTMEHDHNDSIDETTEQQNETTQQKLVSTSIINIIIEYCN
jgi:hypothetical protein